jgi:hypothetical protein
MMFSLILNQFFELNLKPIFSQSTQSTQRKSLKTGFKTNDMAFLCELGVFARDAFDFIPWSEACLSNYLLSCELSAYIPIRSPPFLSKQ